MELLDKLGIDWRLLIAQIVNFAVLLFVLHRFLYKPILGVLEKRRKEIEENERRTKLLTEKVEKAEREYEKRILEAEKKSQTILKKAEENAEKLKSELIEEGRKNAVKILEEAKERSLREKAEIQESLEKEVSGLVKESVRKVLVSIADENAEKALWEKAAKVLKNHES